MEDSILMVLFIVFMIGYIIFDLFKNNINWQDKDYENKVYNSIIKKTKKVIEKHKIQLAIQRKKSVYVDDYGKKITKKWKNNEIPYFIKEHIYPTLNTLERMNIFIAMDEIINLVDQAAKKQKLSDFRYSDKMSGKDFEIFCMHILRKSGWDVSKTKDGADQGVDLIIQKGNRKIAVQCKKHSKPIGNKAVQEVKSGINFYNLNEGIVISNNSYTMSAIELAKFNCIKLLHYLEIHKI